MAYLDSSNVDDLVADIKELADDTYIDNVAQNVTTAAGIMSQSRLIRAGTNIALGSTGVTLEQYARGVVSLTSDGQNSVGTMVAVGYNGKIYSCFFTDGEIKNAQIHDSSYSYDALTLSNATAGGNTSYCYRSGNTVTVFLDLTPSQASSTLQVATLPSSYRPPVDVRTTITPVDHGNPLNGTSFALIETTGAVKIYASKTVRIFVLFTFGVKS